MLNSIIIPHRDRPGRLIRCLQSIFRSAGYTGASEGKDFEVLVVDSSTKENVFSLLGWGIVVDSQEDGLYNKPKALNRGIDSAHGEILTFLDGDMLVGKRFLGEWVKNSLQSGTTRVCYRVRDLSTKGMPDAARTKRIVGDSVFWGQVDKKWETYDSHKLRFESRRNVEKSRSTGEPVFGNSQFSILRSSLGDLRWNEEFKGAGFEDLWFIREIYRKFGEEYRGYLSMDPDRCLFHIKHEKVVKGWREPEQARKNQALFKRS